LPLAPAEGAVHERHETDSLANSSPLSRESVP
jgi:hypothetical protein